MAKLDREHSDYALCRLDGYRSTEGLPRSYFIHKPVMAGRPEPGDADYNPNPFKVENEGITHPEQGCRVREIDNEGLSSSHGGANFE